MSIQKRMEKDSQSDLGVTDKGIVTETFLKISKFLFFFYLFLSSKRCPLFVFFDFFVIYT